MVNKTMSIMVVLLMMSPLFLLGGVIPQGSTISMQQNSIESNANLAETDLGRVTWEENVFPNRGIEEWSSPYIPNDLYTVRSTEEASWYETTVVNEGAKAFGMHARAIDPSHSSEVRLTQQSWVYWDNPTNATLDLDVYLDEIGNPVDQDFYQMRVRMSNRNIYYYIGCEITGATNGSSGYFFLDCNTQAWNHIHRNLTSDYISVFGLEPLQFQYIEWYVRSYSTIYTRVYMDDVNLVNGTTVKVGGSILNGNFEGTGDWTFQASTDPADISQSSIRQEGDWSMNITAISYDYNSYAYASYRPNKLLSLSNQGQLSVWWRIDNWTNPSTSNYARIVISANNATTDFTLYYYLCVGGTGTLPPVIGGNSIKIKVDDFNVTNTWNYFDTNIWQDFSSVFTTENLWIDEIEMRVSTNEDNSHLSVLFDNLSFVTSILNDMDYEHQNEAGTPVEGWSSPPGPDEITVTDFAFSGTKAANLTLIDNQQIHEYQPTCNLPINSATELILDFNVYIDSFNESSEDYVFFELEFEDTSFSYVIANSTSQFEDALGEEDGYFILLQDTIVVGEWLNFQLDIVHDYDKLFGSLPNTALTDFSLTAEGGTDSKLTVFFDNLFIYYDPAPEVSNIQHTLIYAPGGGPASAIINATAIDATLESVVLNYRVNNGSWQYVSMSHTTASIYRVNITNLVGNLVVEYSITATDAFSKTITALNGTEFYTFSVSTGTLPGPDLIGPVLVVVAILAIGVVALLYVFVYRKK